MYSCNRNRAFKYLIFKKIVFVIHLFDWMQGLLPYSKKATRRWPLNLFLSDLLLMLHHHFSNSLTSIRSNDLQHINTIGQVIR